MHADVFFLMLINMGNNSCSQLARSITIIIFSKIACITIPIFGNHHLHELQSHTFMQLPRRSRDAYIRSGHNTHHCHCTT